MAKAALVKNTDSKKQVEKAEKREQRKVIYDREYSKQVLETYAGRRVLFEIIGWCGVYREQLAPEVHQMAFMAGQSAIGRKLIAEIEDINPTAYAEMMIENNKPKGADNV